MHYFSEGRAQEAEALLAQAQALQKETPQEEFLSQIMNSISFAYTQMAMQRIDDGEAAFKKALNFAIRLHGQEGFFTAMIYQGLALCRISLSDLENA